MTTFGHNRPPRKTVGVEVRHNPSQMHDWRELREEYNHDAEKLAILDMLNEGCSLDAIEERYGVEHRDWANAIAWEFNGADKEDESGWAAWMRIFGPNRPPGWD